MNDSENTTIAPESVVDNAQESTPEAVNASEITPDDVSTPEAAPSDNASPIAANPVKDTNLTTAKGKSAFTMPTIIAVAVVSVIALSVIVGLAVYANQETTNEEKVETAVDNALENAQNAVQNAQNLLK